MSAWRCIVSRPAALRRTFRGFGISASVTAVRSSGGLGPFADHVGLFAGMRPRQRVEILLQLLGGEQRVTLATKDIEVVR